MPPGPPTAKRLAIVADYAVQTGRVIVHSRLLRPERPDRLLRGLRQVSRYGPTPAAGFVSASIRFPDRDAIIDEAGTLSFGEVNRRTDALTNALAARGVRSGDGVAIMCRNHRGFVEATVACSKLGATALYLNTSFAGPQIADVIERENPAVVIFDQEFENLVHGGAKDRKRVIAWADGPTDDPTLEQLIEQASSAPPEPPAEPGKFVILTSGTTGRPKGARRKEPDNLLPIIAMLSKIPVRTAERTLIAAPMFHSWGFAHFTLGLPLGSTYVLQRRFDPEATLAGIEQHRVTTVPMVPVMLQRILELPQQTRRKYDTSSLRLVPVSGSQLTGELANRFMDEFGEVVTNLYGSTEVAWATIATPQDLRAAPGTAGRPPVGTELKILDEAGNPLPAGQTGRIFVGNSMLFEGYTGGGSKEQVGALMSTGDVGHVDAAGRLFVEGRDDEMIVSGGENVYPHEVEELLVSHEQVGDAAVIGVDDADFGQRLKAFVVKTPDSQLTDDELKAYVKTNLARYKVPREIEFMDELPRNATGKVLKKDLR
jgi:fatty-acyl-CoA synthase